MFDFINIEPQLYQPIYIWTVFSFCVMLFFYNSTSDNCDKLLKKGSAVPALGLTILLILFIGLRPEQGHGYFGDSANYAWGYNLMGNVDNVDAKVDTHIEWLWALIRDTCKMLGFTVTGWFFVIAIGYWGFTFLALRRMLWESTWFAILFFLSAYSTYSFSINGLRNGLACSMIVYAISLATVHRDTGSKVANAANNTNNFIFAAIIAFLAFGIHRSTILPISSCLLALFVFKKPSYAICFWILSIPVSLLWGSTISNFFADLGFDDRMTSYLHNAKVYEKSFSHGLEFRWDFLLYSSMPVLLTWYVNKKKSPAKDKHDPDGTDVIADANSMKVFNVLATTYILSNAFWVMVIKSSFSNRFAYLSWFLYPIVIAYAVIRLHIWKDQDRKSAMILLAHAAFTLFMFLLGK